MGIKRGAAPVHAGIIFKEMIIDVLPNMSINYAAKALDVSRAHLTEVANGRARITPRLALKISIATNTTTQLWLGMQNAFDLWEIENNKDNPIQVVEGSLTTSNASL
ncbi:MAG: HigA family addiction module antidote protein [Alphaproteobacteria bacterium]|nr:HigA family addiction module antidote protein [Alphaproteobacteria bacterium]